MFRRAVSLPRRLVASSTRGFASYETPHANYVPATVTTLANGVRVVSQASDSPGVHLAVYLDAGGRSSHIQGSANFVHQLAISDPKLHSSIESIGGALQSEIGVDFQMYNTVLPSPADAGRALELIGKAVTQPELTTEKIENTKADCLFSLDNDPRPTQAILQERLRIACWRDGDLGYALYGTHDAISEMNDAKVQQQLKINQTGKRIVVSATGAVNHQELVAAATKALGGLNGDVPFITPDKPYFFGSELVYRDDEMGATAYMAVGYKAVSSTHPYAPAFQLLRQLIGDFDRNQFLVPHKISGNRAKEAVAHKMNVGCCDKYHIFNNSYKDTGMIGWYFETDERAVTSLTDEMMYMFNYHSFSTTEEEIDRAKREMVIARSTLMEDGTALASHNSRSLCHMGRVVPWAEWYHRIMGLNAPEINKICYERIHDEEIVITGLGPLHGHESYYHMRRQNMTWRYGF